MLEFATRVNYSQSRSDYRKCVKAHLINESSTRNGLLTVTTGFVFANTLHADGWRQPQLLATRESLMTVMSLY